MAKTVSEQPEIIYSMMRVSKMYNQKPVIKDISLSYFYGAKIGVLGLNGSGKSTLLKIMAGVDTEFEGEATPMPGLKIGYLAQEVLLYRRWNARGSPGPRRPPHEPGVG